MQLRDSNSAFQADEKASSQDGFVWFSEAASRTGTPLSTLYFWADQGMVPVHRIRWHKSRRKIDVEWLIEERRAGRLYTRERNLHLPGGFLIKTHPPKGHRGHRLGKIKPTKATPDLLAVAARLAAARRITQMKEIGHE